MGAKVELMEGKRIPKNPVIIEAFPSKGYVSTIAGSYMIKKLGMEYVGYIHSNDLEAVTVVHDKKPMRPIRIYQKDNLVLIFSEIMIPLEMIHDFSEDISEWIKEVKPSKIILLANIMGINTEKDHEIFGVACGEESLKNLGEAEVKMLDEGVLTGMSSSLMLRCMDNGFSTIALMVETRYIPDVLAASSILKILNKILGLEIDIKGLEDTGKDIEGQVKNLMEQFKTAHEGHEELKDMSNLPMYR
ncbi:MAG: PAC2 family protein [Candidatus Altiarchaeota archaeon]